MATLAEEMAATALELITEFGALATFSVPTGYSYTPTTGIGLDPTAPLTGMVVPDDMAEGLLPDDNVLAGTSRFFLAAQNLTFTPIVTMKMALYGKTWSLHACGPVYVQDRIVLWILNAGA